MALAVSLMASSSSRLAGKPTPWIYSTTAETGGPLCVSPRLQRRLHLSHLLEELIHLLAQFSGLLAEGIGGAQNLI